MRRLASLAGVTQTGARPTMKAEAAAGARQSRLLEGGEDRSGRAALPVARGAQQCAEPLEVAVGNGCIARSARGG